jgi:hypothetical protein
MRKGWVEETEEQEQEKQRAATPASALPSFKPSFVLGGEVGLNMVCASSALPLTTALITPDAPDTTINGRRVWPSRR